MRLLRSPSRIAFVAFAFLAACETDSSNLVVALVPSRVPPFTVRAIGAGTGRIIVRLDVHRASTARDTATLTVTTAAPSVRSERH